MREAREGGQHDAVRFCNRGNNLNSSPTDSPRSPHRSADPRKGLVRITPVRHPLSCGPASPGWETRRNNLKTSPSAPAARAHRLSCLARAQGDYGLAHFQWTDRATNAVVDVRALLLVRPLCCRPYC